MTSDLEIALAVLFKRTGSPATADKLVHAVSLGFGWCRPSEAWNLVARGLEAKLVRELPDGRFASQFNPQGATVPLGFEPPAALFQPAPGLRASAAAAPPEDPSDLFETILGRLGDAGLGRQAAVAEVNKTHASVGRLVSLEVAGILTLLARGLDAADLVAQAARATRAQEPI